MPVIPATWEAEEGESLDPGRQRLQSAEIAQLHSSLGNKSEIPSQKKPHQARHGVSKRTEKKSYWRRLDEPSGWFLTRSRDRCRETRGEDATWRQRQRLKLLQLPAKEHPSLTIATHIWERVMEQILLEPLKYFSQADALILNIWLPRTVREYILVV